ncbi:hypothetical protein D3C85_1054800 [compost metagenome]
MPETHATGTERYRVEETGRGFWPYCVRAGDGTRELFIGHRKQCEIVAAELATAFEDGKFVAAPAAPQQGEYGDAYQGAREDLAIWKRRALEAEEAIRQKDQIIDHLVLEAQGEMRMGEPFIATAPCAHGINDGACKECYDLARLNPSAQGEKK